MHPFGLSRSERKAVRNNRYTNKLDGKKLGGVTLLLNTIMTTNRYLIAIAGIDYYCTAASACRCRSPLRIAAAKHSVNDERRVNQGAKLETNGHGHLPAPLAAS